MSAEAPSPGGLSPREKWAYRIVTLVAVCVVGVLSAWGLGTYIQHKVDSTLREQRPIYTLECRPKGEG